jgi:hypothetical protein
MLIVFCSELSASIIGRGAMCLVKFVIVFISYPRECQDSTLIVLWKCVVMCYDGKLRKSLCNIVFQFV